jgi:hypothetical protein
MALPRFFDRVGLAVAGALVAPGVTTATLAKELGGRIVEVKLPETPHGSDECVAEMLVNLVARLYPTLRLVGPRASCTRFERLARAINPRVTFAAGDAPALVALVGNSSAPSSRDYALRVQSDGWVARLLTPDQVVVRGPPNPYAAAAAACFAAGELFRQSFASAVPPAKKDVVSVSLLDFSESAGEFEALPEALDIGEVGFAGVGAVASGALWAMAQHSGLRGDVHLIDPDVSELSNLERYVLLDEGCLGKPKVNTAAKFLERTRLQVTRHRKTLEALAGERRRGFATICVSLDNIIGRRAAQALLPRVAVNAWTRDRGLGVSSHRLGNGAPCLNCLYMPAGDRPSQSAIIAQTIGLEIREAAELFFNNGVPTAEQLAKIAAKTRASSETTAAWKGKRIRELFTDVCGAANLNVREDGQPESVPLAYQSALAGVLMAAELVKQLSPDLASAAQCGNVITWHDVTGCVPGCWIEPFPVHPRCICSDRIYRDTYKAKWRDADASDHANPPRDVIGCNPDPVSALEAVDGT